MGWRTRTKPRPAGHASETHGPILERGTPPSIPISQISDYDPSTASPPTQRLSCSQTLPLSGSAGQGRCSQAVPPRSFAFRRTSESSLRHSSRGLDTCVQTVQQVSGPCRARAFEFEGRNSTRAPGQTRIISQHQEFRIHRRAIRSSSASWAPPPRRRPLGLAGARTHWLDSATTATLLASEKPLQIQNDAQNLLCRFETTSTGYSLVNKTFTFAQLHTTP